MALESTAPSLASVFTAEVRAAMAERDERVRQQERDRIVAQLNEGLDGIRSGGPVPPAAAVVMRHVDRRLSWPSMHWGVEGVHPDAWPHIAKAAIEGVLAQIEVAR